VTAGIAEMEALLERKGSDEDRDTCIKRWNGSGSLIYLVLNSLCASSINHALNDLVLGSGDPVRPRGPYDSVKRLQRGRLSARSWNSTV